MRERRYVKEWRRTGGSNKKKRSGRVKERIERVLRARWRRIAGGKKEKGREGYEKSESVKGKMEKN